MNTDTQTVPAPTERELEILKILWDLSPKGGASVRQVFDVMRKKEDLAQNTVQTFLRLMEDKGLVAHTAVGRSFIYRPLYSRQKSVTRFLNRVFDGAVDQLLAAMVSTKKLSADELSAMEQIIAAEKKKQKERGSDKGGDE